MTPPNANAGVPPNPAVGAGMLIALPGLPNTEAGLLTPVPVPNANGVASLLPILALLLFIPNTDAGSGVASLLVGAPKLNCGTLEDCPKIAAGLAAAVFVEAAAGLAVALALPNENVGVADLLSPPFKPVLLELLILLLLPKLGAAAVSYTHLDVYKRQILFPQKLIANLLKRRMNITTSY